MSAIIIGFGTTVGGDFSNACAVSVQWGYNPNAQRLYCLGEFTPAFTIQKPTETLSITIYGDDGSGPTYSTTPSNDCSNANTLNASVSPAACGPGVDGVSGDWYVQSYSYSKDDPQLPGQESWSMTRWVAGPDPDSSEPTYVFRMTSEGEASDATLVGITFTTGQTLAEGTTGSVSAGAIGQASTMQYGTVDSVGGSSAVSGDIESGSASMNYQPFWIDLS
jgi:hypothetical protein